VRKDKIKY